MTDINKTHDPLLKSWVDSANTMETDFPIQNLPFAVFRRAASAEPYRGGIAIGDQVIDLAAVKDSGALGAGVHAELEACSLPKLNEFMAMGKDSWSALRHALSAALSEGSDSQATMQACLLSQSEVEFDVPARIGDYTDFYTSINHATNIGKLFRPDNPLLPNYQWIPIGYHGRSSSIDVSGQSFHRPQGQLKGPDAEQPTLAPCKRLDYELEVGIYIGEGNDLGSPIALAEAEAHVFGLCLFNDWSARDIQAWEYQPLGPFLAKNFASTVSPWIVTMEALAPYRAAWSRPEDHPQPLPYLDSEAHRASGAVDMSLEVLLETEKMRENGTPPKSIAVSNFIDSYWTIAQMVTHHSVNGCNLVEGDFFGSGTQSGKTPDQAGSMMESSQGGKQAIDLGNGEQRIFLEDGDKVIMRGFCAQEGMRRIGFGEVEGTVLPAKV
jgi:fumarylacetoacetase